MAFAFTGRTPWWAWAAPALGLALLAVGMIIGIAPHWFTLLLGVALFPVVFAAVYHAEVIAHRVGEPFGTLVLALAVTVIEGSLIIALMIEGGPAKAGLVRDTLFAAVMIVCNGIVGLCLLSGGVRHHIQSFQLEGALSALAVMAAMTTLTMVLPNYTLSTPGPTLAPSQLVFAGIVSLVLYAAFVFVQTIRHRDFFLPSGGGDEDSHAAPPSNRAAVASVALLLLALAGVVGLAKLLSPTVDVAVAAAGAAPSVVGIIIAIVVLLPEGVAAYRAARLNRLQTSMNLALGSVLATIGLTMPVVAVVSIAIGQPLALGLGPKETALLALTLVLSVITLGTGRTTILQGIVHLAVFVVFLFLAVVP